MIDIPRRYIAHEVETLANNGKMIKYLVLMHRDGVATARAIMYPGAEHAYLDNLSVNESHRRQGIATELQTIREAWAKSNGTTNVQLDGLKEAWTDTWFQRRGYKRNGDYNEQSYYYIKELPK